MVGELKKNKQLKRKEVKSSMKPKFTEEEQEEYGIDEDGYYTNGYGRVIRCEWCGEIEDECDCKHEHNMGWLCSRCLDSLFSRGEKVTIDYNYEDEDE